MSANSRSDFEKGKKYFNTIQQTLQHSYFRDSPQSSRDFFQSLGNYNCWREMIDYETLEEFVFLAKTPVKEKQKLIDSIINEFF